LLLKKHLPNYVVPTPVQLQLQSSR